MTQAILNKPMPEGTVVKTIFSDCVMVAGISDPEISLAILPWLNPAEQRLDLGWKVHEHLRESPDDIYVAIAMKPDSTPQAVVVAFCRDEDVLLLHTSALPTFAHSRWMFDDLVKWTKEKGRKKITTERWGEIEPLVENYGFYLASQRKENGCALSELVKDL